MSELYWIITLGNIGKAATVIVSFATVTFLILLLALMLCLSEYEETTIISKKITRCLKVDAVVLAISVGIAVFVPSTKELLAIYGIGGTLDYLRNNNEARRLPDKVVKAASIYLDKLSKEGKKDNRDDK